MKEIQVPPVSSEHHNQYLPQALIDTQNGRRGLGDSERPSNGSLSVEEM